jgi:hypothetical protein
MTCSGGLGGVFITTPPFGKASERSWPGYVLGRSCGAGFAGDFEVVFCFEAVRS